MNNEIKHLYEGLDELPRRTIGAIFEQSPKMLLYINLLEQGELIFTNKAVNYIYQEEQNTISRNVLINRFYKLRSSLRLWLLTQLKNSPICLNIEEQELTFLRLMVIKNEHHYAIQKLQLLEQKCWNQNLFELLPEVIQLLLRSIYACKSLDKNEQEIYLEKLKLANELRAVLQSLKFGLCSLQQDIKSYQGIVETSGRKVKKLKQYPRLMMLYHYIGFAGGAYVEDIVQKKSNALSRHLNQLKTLKKIYPTIPLADYEPLHREKTEVHLCAIEAIFWYYKQKPKKSYEAVQRRKKLIEEQPNLHLKISEAELHNMIYFCINAEEYITALEYIEELKEYQSNNPYEKKDSPYYTYLLVVYIALFPNKKHLAPEELIGQIKLFLETFSTSSPWIYGSLAEFCILYGYYEEAKEFLEQDTLKQLFKDDGISIQTDKLLSLILLKDAKALKEFAKELQYLYQHADSSKHQFHYKGILKITQYFIGQEL